MHNKKSSSKKWISILAATVSVVVLLPVVLAGCGDEESIPAEVANATHHVENSTDASGNTVKSNLYDPDNQLRAYDTYEYDAKGNRTKKVHHDSNGKVLFQETYEYNEKGFKTKQTVLDEKGVIKESYVYEIVNGQQTGLYKYVGAKETLDSYIKYEFDAKGECIKETSYTAAGEIKYYTEYTYDAEGNRSSKKYDAEGKLIG